MMASSGELHGEMEDVSYCRSVQEDASGEFNKEDFARKMQEVEAMIAELPMGPTMSEVIKEALQKKRWAGVEAECPGKDDLLNCKMVDRIGQASLDSWSTRQCGNLHVVDDS